MKKEAELIEKAQPTDIVQVAEKYASQDQQLELTASTAREKLRKAREANDAKAIQAAQKELNETNKSRDGIADTARNELLQIAATKSKGQFVSSIRPPGSGMMDDKNKKMEPVMDTQ